MGSSSNAPVPAGEPSQCSSAGKPKTLCNQRVGLATALTPYGPWARRDQPIIGVGAAGTTWDDLFTTNPTPHVFANGSALLIYKARSSEDFNNMRTGVAFAKHWGGPYERVGSGPIDVPGGCEDAGIYYSEAMQVFRMVLHCGCSYQSVWSTDGANWRRTADPVPWCNVSMAAGNVGDYAVLRRRERPKWLVDPESGRPIGLFTGVEPSGDMHSGQTFTMATDVLE